MRLAVLALVLLAGCSTTPTGEVMVASANVPPSGAPAASPSPAPAPAGLPSGYPWARLRLASNPVEPLDRSFAAVAARAGASSVRAFTATSPRVWLLVFEFRSYARAHDAEAQLVEALERDGVHHPKVTLTGGWLLVTGFPSEKPVSPEMERARGAFAQSFAGEE